MSKPVYRQAQKPTKEIKHQTGSPTLDFLKTFDMLTQDELRAYLIGDVAISDDKKSIMNVNANLPNFPTGTWQPLYPGRGTIVTARNFLEL